MVSSICTWTSSSGERWINAVIFAVVQEKKCEGEHSDTFRPKMWVSVAITHQKYPCPSVAPPSVTK
eukprot:scaffold201477_cov24-Attheya_sp.AAC.1